MSVIFSAIASRVPWVFFDRVEVPRLLGSLPKVAPMTWHEILGEVGILLGAAGAHLIIASFVQVSFVEHAGEDNPVWKCLRRKIPPPSATSS